MFFPLLWIGGAALLAYIASQSSTPTNTPPQKRPPDMPPTPSPNLALAILQSWDGRSINDPDPAAWAGVLLRNDKPSWAVFYLKQHKSTCALVGKAYLYEGGCRCREQGPYQPRDGMAVADIETIARRHGAWINDPIGKSTAPNPGDIYTIDPGNPHVVCVLGMDGPTGYVHSMDGGQGAFGAYTRGRCYPVPGRCGRRPIFPPWLSAPHLRPRRRRKSLQHPSPLQVVSPNTNKGPTHHVCRSSLRLFERDRR